LNATTVKAYSKAKDSTKGLSENFKAREFACSDGSDMIFIADSLLAVLQQLRSHFKTAPRSQGAVLKDYSEAGRA